FFAALRLQAQRDEVHAGIADLQSRLRTARERVEAGAALPGEAAMLEAELLRREQTVDELDARRSAALAVLGDLTGRPVDTASVLVIPELGERAASALE